MFLLHHDFLNKADPHFIISEFTYDATKWLIEKRKIAGIGTECPDIELNQNGQVKLLLAQKGHYSVVQLTNLKKLPARGFYVNIAPLKLRNGSGGPTRIFASLNHHTRHKSQNSINKNEVCKDYIKVKRQEQIFSSAISIQFSTSIHLTIVTLILHLT